MQIAYRYRLRIFFLLLISIFFIGNQLLYSQDSNENLLISVSELPILEGESLNGCKFYKFLVKNLTDKNLNLTIRLESENNYRNSVVEIEKSIQLRAKESREERIIDHSSFSDESRVAVFYYDKQIVSKISLFSSNRYRNYYKHILLDKLITQEESELLFNNSDKAVHDFKTHYFSSNLDMMDTEWQGYSQFDALVFYDHTFEDMPNNVQNAIFDYVRAGGKLVILGNISFPNDVITVKKSFASAIPETAKVGFGSIYIFNEDMLSNIQPIEKKHNPRGNRRSEWPQRKEPKIETINSNKKYNSSDIITALSFDESSFDNEFYKKFDTYSYFYSNYTVITNTAALSGLIILFAFLIAPINHWFLKKKNKKILIFITVPIISVFCCSLVYFYYLIFEYNRLEIYRQSFTILDEESSKSVTLGSEVIISGKNISNQVSFPYASLILPDKNDRKSTSSSNTRRIIKIDNGLNFTDGWIRAKIPFKYSVASIKQDRSRIEFKNVNDKLEALNGLGADIKYICYRSGSSIYEGSDISAGAVGYLTEKNFKTNSMPKIDSSFNYDKFLKSCLEGEKGLYLPSEFIRPGEYLVLLKTNPFMQQKLDKQATIKELGCVVIGRSKETAI